VSNASNTDVVLAELPQRVSGDAVVTDETAATGLISIQGPDAVGRLAAVTDVPLAGMRYYSGAYGSVAGRPAWVARTGYTGEDGFEIFCAAEDAVAVWDALAVACLPAPGPAARDTPPLEGGI